MKRSDITDRQVVEACKRYREQPLSSFIIMADDMLQQMTGAPIKVCHAAMERAYDRGFIEWGVSVRSCYPTAAGLALL